MVSDQIDQLAKPRTEDRISSAKKIMAELERISIQLSRLVKLTSLQNPKNQYEIDMASSQLDHLADSNIL